MDLALWAPDHGVPAAELAAVLGLAPSAGRAVYADIDAKRRTAPTCTHAPALVEPVLAASPATRWAHLQERSLEPCSERCLSARSRWPGAAPRGAALSAWPPSCSALAATLQTLPDKPEETAAAPPRRCGSWPPAAPPCSAALAAPQLGRCSTRPAWRAGRAGRSASAACRWPTSPGASASWAWRCSPARRLDSPRGNRAARERGRTLRALLPRRRRPRDRRLHRMRQRRARADRLGQVPSRPGARRDLSAEAVALARAMRRSWAWMSG